MTSQTNPRLSYGNTLVIYAALLALTAGSVFLTLRHLGRINLWAPLGIGIVQASLVVLFFMHMNRESRLWKLFFLLVLVILALFIGLTYVDVLFR